MVFFSANFLQTWDVFLSFEHRVGKTLLKLKIKQL